MLGEDAVALVFGQSLANLSGQIFKTTDSGITWQLQFSSEDVLFRSVGFANSLKGWAGILSDDLLWQTSDGG